MTIVIEIYIIICIALLLFDLGFLFFKNRRTNALYPGNTKFEKQALAAAAQCKKSGALPREFAEKLPKKLSKVRNLISLVGVMSRSPENKKIFAPVLYHMIDEYAKKNHAEQAYYTYAVSLLDYDPQAMPADFMGKFMNFLNAKDLYTFANTMDALYHFGQADLLIQALDKVDERGAFYHSKLLVDGLLASKVDFEKLNPMVVEKFKGYTPYMQDSMLDFFRMNNYDVHQLCMQLLRDETVDREVRCGAMRYFAKFPTKESDAFFLELLKKEDQDWLPQMLAIQALSKDDDAGVRTAIRNKITSPDWYVRVNAAKYLFKHNLTHDEIYGILEKRDRYSSEILQYCCREDAEMSAYIEKLIAFFKEDEKDAGKPKIEPKPALTVKEA